ncbi:hypothetical protein [uncultured Desulfobacter sp.]|uniref:hypothetical protein n=1 Tax=uncultured Desulfobacter sp. TaxID=240139 RepID=UPI0029F4AAED|nr:hypothetical protein [uncultured Desulfobacter sp.]
MAGRIRGITKKTRQKVAGCNGIVNSSMLYDVIGILAFVTEGTVSVPVNACVHIQTKGINRISPMQLGPMMRSPKR